MWSSKPAVQISWLVNITFLTWTGHGLRLCCKMRARLQLQLTTLTCTQKHTESHTTQKVSHIDNTRKCDSISSLLIKLKVYVLEWRESTLFSCLSVVEGGGGQWWWGKRLTILNRLFKFSHRVENWNLMKYNIYNIFKDRYWFISYQWGRYVFVTLTFHLILALF